MARGAARGDSGGVARGDGGKPDHGMIELHGDLCASAWRAEGAYDDGAGHIGMRGESGVIVVGDVDAKGVAGFELEGAIDHQEHAGG